jgi:uncharacterized NAD(P)/FAD-binding protein YdhS
LQQDGALSVTAGRILGCDAHADGVTALLRPRGGRARALEADILINCTGPDLNPRRGANPLLENLIAQELADVDPLGLGLESEDSAVRGGASSWIHALGPLTRPAWWEIVAVPEINAQIDRLVRRLGADSSAETAPLHAVFLDIGAGI